jgi:hypothetical protein
VTKNQTTEHKNLQVPALTINPAEYTVAIIANNSIAPLLTDGLIRPLDDLVEEFGQDLQENQFVRIDGRIMAIAFMGNAQHLHYRGDVVEELGIEPPTSYEAILEAAETIRAEGRDGAPARRQLRRRLGPRGRVRQHVPRPRRRVLRAGLGRARDQQRDRRAGARDHEGALRLHGPRLPLLHHQRAEAGLGGGRHRVHEPVGLARRAR